MPPLRTASSGLYSQYIRRTWRFNGRIGSLRLAFLSNLAGTIFTPGVSFARVYARPTRLICAALAAIDKGIITTDANTADALNSDAAVGIVAAEDLRMDLPFLPAEEQARINERLRFLVKNPDIFTQRIIQLTPQMMLLMLLMLPFWALFLKLIYVFRRHYYLEHLTVALHTHGFILLSLMLAVGAAEVTTALASLTGIEFLSRLGSWIDFSIFTWMFIYLFLTQKNFYQQGWLFTAVKFLVSGFAYSLLLLSVFVITVVYSVITA
ncbi:hypothetical protein [Pseudidiomarina donghaiensis]|uniref:hypothetical protein n=1 Tax=Pseudidiomarina donghaiensis TaxID=519452 RepID=UPI0008DF9B77|nr:hypothetical protein [Pseudidiomarina donghaiensis]SFV23922.1 hypothetical protein SAMN04488139_2038 [Pseudidiomarina donghaiensis]